MRIPELDTDISIAFRPVERAFTIDAAVVARVGREIGRIPTEAIREVMLAEYRRREQRRLERELQRGRPRPVQCFSCRRCWKARPSSICTRCGDDPVTRTTHMDATPVDRQRFDESYYGERVL